MSKKYYQKNKEMLKNKTRESYQILSEKETNRKHQNGCERYRNLTKNI